MAQPSDKTELPSLDQFQRKSLDELTFAALRFLISWLLHLLIALVSLGLNQVLIYFLSVIFGVAALEILLRVPAAAHLLEPLDPFRLSVAVIYGLLGCMGAVTGYFAARITRPNLDAGRWLFLILPVLLLVSWLDNKPGPGVNWLTDGFFGRHPLYLFAPYACCYSLGALLVRRGE